jgi:hypothetical protein
MHASTRLADTEDEAFEPTPYTQATLFHTHTQAPTKCALSVPQHQYTIRLSAPQALFPPLPANDADVVLFLVGGAQVAGRAGPAVVHDLAKVARSAAL